MDALVQSLDWGCQSCPSPGSHSSLPDDDVLPWQCVSEVIPGLFLTCESEVADKAKCVASGYTLVVNLCGDAHVSKYRVYEKNSEDGLYAFRRFDGQSDFFVALNDYCQGSARAPAESKKLFLVTIPAEDNPTYSIDAHFLECAVLIEVVLRARTADVTADASTLPGEPSVVVHCMVGVSRSAAVVVAYMMKKYGMLRDEAIHFIRSTRPVIQPNPGFQRQLELWEELRGYRVVDELSAKVLSAETRRKANVLEVVSVMLPTILRVNKCERERHVFGDFLRDVDPTSDELHAVFRELRSIVTADVDCEVYTDIPNYFGYIAEVVCGIDRAAPALLQHASIAKNMTTCNDAFYYRVLKDVARSGFEKDPLDTARGFCALFEAVYVKHLSETGDGRPRTLECGDAGVPPPAGCALSFPFLYLVAPYAEGFVQFSEWAGLATSFGTAGAALSADREQQLVNAVLDTMLQFFFRSSCGGTDGAAGTYTKLGYLQDDLEVVNFRKLEEMWRSSGASIVSVDMKMAMPSSDDASASLTLVLKAVSGIVAFRLVLEAAEQFLTQTYASRLTGGAGVADRLLSLSTVSAAIAGLESAYAERYAQPANIVEFYRAELSGMLDNGVLNSSGVVTLFYTPS